jgi:uncharacterized repeat protein (TIGR03803 family)
MTNPQERPIIGANLPAAIGAIALAIVFLLFLAAAGPAAQAQTYQVLHYFQSGQDGANPAAGVTIDQAGNLYGTTYNIFGTVFKMRPVNSGWILTPLKELGFEKGAFPQAGVIKGPDGTLYGTTSEGGGNCYCGVVFNLKPPPNASSYVLEGWTETILYSFNGGSDGANPGYGNLVFDQAGNLYGTTQAGGAYGQGTVFKLTPSNGGWTESILYSFTGSADGGTPYAGVIFDKAGNLYGTTSAGGEGNNGTVFELTPSGSGWIEVVLHSFQDPSQGTVPYGGLMFDASGNLYGTTQLGGLGGYSGSVFELSPSNGSWTFAVLHLFDFSKYEGASPLAGVTMGADGNLYGTTLGGGVYESGAIFELTYSAGSWTYKTLHDFDSNTGDSPFGGVTFDSKGNMYGTAFLGGTGACNLGCGVVWEITP